MSMEELRGWEHDCGFKTDSESLFIQHIDECSAFPEELPIYRAVIDEHGHVTEVIDD